MQTERSSQMDVANLCVTPQTQKNVCCKTLLKNSLSLWALKLLEINDKYLVKLFTVTDSESLKSSKAPQIYV